MIDVDFFKQYNDRYGHQAGDDCLRQVAKTIKSCLQRPADLVARYGGEEFACVLAETGLDDAMKLAAAIEQAVRGLALPHATSTVAPVVSVSVGVATRQRDGAPFLAADLLRLADAELYQAKQAGRAQVIGAALAAQVPASA